MLWAPYFRARALVASIPRSPEKASQLVAQARIELEPTRSGFVNPQVWCFRNLVAVIDSILAGSPTAAAEVSSELKLGERLFGLDETDRLAGQFIDELTRAFTEADEAREDDRVRPAARGSGHSRPDPPRGANGDEGTRTRGW